MILILRIILRRHFEENVFENHYIYMRSILSIPRLESFPQVVSAMIVTSHFVFYLRV